jgi:Rha family phage regulatory protein
MNELTIIKRGDAAYIKRGDAAYIDSREVANIIGKRHDHLLRDISGYLKILGKINAPNFGGVDFFRESAYFDAKGESRPCYLITRKGADVIANKLTGEKGVLFTAAYVTKFHEMSEREHKNEVAELKAQAATPRLKVFNTAVRNVLTGYRDTYATSGEIMSFLRGAYKPFGIEITPVKGKHRYTATEIAQYLCVYSESGLYHSHAISAIIEKLHIAPEHISVSPYGAVGITTYYDGTVIAAVEDWLVDNNFPHDIPHLYFEYHVYYDYDRYEQLSLFSCDDRNIRQSCEDFNDEADWLDEIGDWFGDEE